MAKSKPTKPPAEYVGVPTNLQKIVNESDPEARHVAVWLGEFVEAHGGQNICYDDERGGVWFSFNFYGERYYKVHIRTHNAFYD